MERTHGRTHLAQAGDVAYGTRARKSKGRRPGTAHLSPLPPRSSNETPLEPLSTLPVKSLCRPPPSWSTLPVWSKTLPAMRTEDSCVWCGVENEDGQVDVDVRAGQRQGRGGQ